MFTVGRRGSSCRCEDQGDLRQHRCLGHVAVASGVYHLQRGLLVRLPARGGGPAGLEPLVVLDLQ